MGRHSDFQLSLQEHNALIAERAKAKKAKDFELDRRLRVILLLGSGGKTRIQVAEICETCESTVYLWLRRYKRHGIQGLRDNYKPKQCRLSVEQQRELQAIVEQGPEAAGFDTGAWTSPLVGKVIKEQYGIVYSVSAIARLLHRLNFSHQLPQVQLSRADPEKQQEWCEKTYPAILERARAEGGVVFFSGTRASSSKRARAAGRGRGWVKEPS